MIVNHKYKFIFLKTRKTAGTSIEIALSQFCGPDDIITPITPIDEEKRQALGYRGPQNYQLDTRHYNAGDWMRRLFKGKHKQLTNHSTAAYVKGALDPNVWDSYFKFSFERDPFDKAISSYYWRTKKLDPRPPIAEFLSTVPERRICNWDVYAIDDDICVDFIGRYEKLNDDLAFVQDKLGLPGDITLEKTKAGHRKNRDHYSKVLDGESRQIIEKVCAREINALNYHWQDQ